MPGSAGFLGLPAGFEEEVPDDDKRRQGREPLGHVVAEAVGEHHAAQYEDGVHGAVFEKDVFLDPVDAIDRELPDDDCTDSVSQQDQGHRQGEGEGPHDAVDGEGQVDDLQVEDLPDVGHVSFAGEQSRLLFLGVALEAVGDEEGRRAHDGPEGKHGAFVQGKPDDGRQRNGDDGIEPGALAGEEALDGESVFFRFEKNPVTEEEHKKDPAPHEQDGRAVLDGLEGCRVAGQARRKGIPGPQARRHDPDDEPGQNPADDENRDQNPPGEKPPSRPGLHPLQDLGVDDGVVDARDRLEEGQSQNDKDR